MKLSRKSAAHKLVEWTWSRPYKGTNFCPFFWQLFFAAILLPLSAVAHFYYKVGILDPFHYNEDPKPISGTVLTVLTFWASAVLALFIYALIAQTVVTVSVLALFTAVVVISVLTFLVKLDYNDRTIAESTSLFVKSKVYDRFCPIIEWTDEEKETDTWNRGM